MLPRPALIDMPSATGAASRMALVQGNDNEDEPALAKGALTKHVSDLVQSTRRKFTLSDILDDKVAVLDVLTSSHTNSHGVDDDPTTMPRDPGEEECDGQRHVAFRQLWERHASSSPGIQFLIDIEELQRTEQDTSTSDWPVDALNAVVDQLYMGMTTSSPTLMLIATRILAKALRWKRNQAVVLRRHVDFLLHVGRAMQTWIESTSSPDDSNAVGMAEEALQHWTTMMEVCLVGSCAVWAAWTDIGMLSVSEAATSRSRPDEAASNHQHADAERQCVDTMDYINHREYSARTTNDSTSSGADFAVMDQYLMMPPFVATVPSVVRCITHVLQQTRTHQLCPVFLPLQLRLLTLVGSLCCVHRSLAITTAIDLLDDAALTTLFDLLLIPTKDVTSVRRLEEEAQFARLVVAVAVDACEAARRPQWPLVAEKLSLLTLTFRWIQDQAMKVAVVAASTASSSSQRTTHDDQPWAVTDIPLHDMLSWEGESRLQVMEDERLFASCATCQAHTAQWDVAGLVASCPSLSCSWNPDEAMATVAAVFESASRCYKALFDGLFLAFVCPSTTSTTTTDDSSTSPTHAFLEHIVMVSLDILNASRTTLHGLSVELHAAMFLRRLFHVNPASMIVSNVLRTVHAWGFLLHHPELFRQAESTEGGGMGQLVRRGEGADGEDVWVFALTGGDSRRRHAATRTHVYTHTLLSSLFVAVVDSSEDKAAILSQVTDAVVQHQQNVRFVYSISRTLDHLARQPHLHSVVYSPSNFASLVAVLTSSSSSIPDSKTALHWVTMLSLLRLVHRHVTADMATANAVLHCEFTSAQRPPLVPTTSTPPYPPQRLLPCLFALLRLRPCVPMVLEMLLMLLKSATVLMFGQSDRHPEATSARLFDFLHAHVFHAFMQTMSELVSYVPHSTTNRVGQDDGIEATVASMVTCVGQLFSFHAAASCKDLQVLFRACNAFVHLTNLLHSPRFVQPRSRHIQITRQVCHVLTLLMARNRDSKAEFRTLMASTASDHERVAYEPLVHVFLAAEDGTPSWESMQVMWNMLVDNESSNSSSSDRIRNPDVIPVLFCLFRHCSPHDQVRFLCQFKRLFRPSSHDSLNRSMCCYVQPGTMDQLLDALEGGLHSLPDLADLVAEIGWHSVGVRQLKRMFRLLQAAPALMAPLVDALYYMVQRHVVDQPSRFFFFDGDQSGLELAPFNVPAKGFTFHTWLLRLEQVSLGPQDSCIYSWLDQHFHGYALMLRNGRIEYHTQTNVWPTTIQLESNTWYCLSVVYSPGSFRLRPEITVFINGDVAWQSEITSVEFDGPVKYGYIGCSVAATTGGRRAIALCGHMLMGAVYFFKKPLPLSHIQRMHQLGPDTVLFGSEYEWNECMAWSYNPSVWEGQYFLDSSCNFQDTDPLHSAARRLDGTYHIFTRSAVDVLECIGGIAVLFPLFAQFDTQSSHDLTANVLKLLCAVLRANAANQRYMTDHHGFLVTGYLLSRVSPHHMTLQALNAMHVFVLGDDESRPFQAQALRFWLADFALWVFTPVDVQIHVVKILHRLVTDSQKSVWPAVLTVRKVLDDLRLYYWFTPPSLVWQQEATDREATVGTIMEGGHDDDLPSLFEVPGSAFSKQEWIHPETKCRVATHLQPGDRLLVRAELWKLVEIICRQKDTDLDQEDVSALCGFLAFSGDECQKVDLLMLLRRLLTTSPLAFRHHLIRLVGEEAQKLAGPSSPLTDDFCPSSAFGSPIQAHDLLFALVLRRPNVTIPVKLLAFELLVEVFTYNSQWPAKTTTPPHTPHLPSSSVYLLCAMDYIEDSYNDLARLCFRLLLGSPTVAKSAEPPQPPPPSSSLVIQNPCVLPSLLTTLLVCDASLCLEIVHDLTQLLGRHKARNNASLFKPFSRLVVLLLLRFSDSADVDRCVNLLGTLVVSQLQTEEDGWCVHHAISSSIKRLVASPALSYTLRCHVIVYVVQHLSAEHATSSPRQPSPLVNKASKWQYLSPDSERQKWYIFYSNVWYLVFAMEIDLCDTGPEPFAWSVATAVVALLQQLEMQYWVTFPLQVDALHPWLSRKGGMVRLVVHLLVAGVASRAPDAIGFLRAYVFHDSFPHARNDSSMVLTLIRDVVGLLRASSSSAYPNRSMIMDDVQFVRELVRRHRGMLQLLLLDSNESVLHGKSTDTNDSVLRLLQVETQLNLQWSIWDSVMPPDSHNTLWHMEMTFQRIVAVVQATKPLLHWELLSTLCKRQRYNAPAMDAMVVNARRAERAVWKVTSEAMEKQRLAASHTWQRILRSLTNERGPWGQPPLPDAASAVSWKLDGSENHMRQRVKLKRYYNAKQAPMPPTVTWLSPDAQISLATELLQAKALASYNEDFYRKHTLALYEDDDNDDVNNSGDNQRMIRPSGSVDVSFACEWIAKTKVQPGRIQIGPTYITLHVEAKKKPKKFTLHDLVCIHFRRYQLQPNALEFFFRDGVTLFVNLHDRKTCQEVDHVIRSMYVPRLYPLGGRSPRQLFERSDLTERWVQRKISNFDYLMHLNTIAGRTYNDLAQYPIFPWVLADYTSPTLDLNNPTTFRNLERPIGVQNDASMAFFKERYNVLNVEYQRSVKGSTSVSMDDMPQLPPFHYGTHYSTSAFVVGFLIRLQPFMNYHLRLQGGKVDHADRLFHSIDAAYKSCTSNPSDVRELIPEFFYLPDFLVHSSSTHEPLGVKQNGDEVNHVELPPWAHNSPAEFIRLHRMALESEYVSLNLHHWIDLIFGHKQRPPLFGGTSHAVDACNVYFHLTYDGAVDLDTLKQTDPHLYHTTLRQIDCFGQTPAQLLFRPHPRRTLATDVIRPLFQALSAGLVGYPRVRLSRFRRPLLFLSIDGDSCVGIDTNRNVSVHKWHACPPDHEPPFHLTTRPSVHYSVGVPFATHAVTTYAETAVVLSSSLFITFRKHLFSCGHWDHSIRLTQLETGRPIQTLRQHHDVVTCIALTDDGTYLVSGSSDNTVMVWAFDVGSEQMVPQHTLYGHDDGVTCVTVSTSYNVVISSSRDGTLIVHTLSNGRYLRTIRPLSQHHKPSRLTWVGLTQTGHVVTYGESTSTLYLYSINGKCLASAVVDQKLHAFYLTKDGQSVVVGGRGQSVAVYRLHDMQLVLEFDGSSDKSTAPRGFQSAIHSLCLSSDEMHLMVGLANGDAYIYTPNAAYLRERLQKRLTNLGF